MFRLLILGGTSFLGRHLVDAALERRHHVTLFNRGKTNPDLYPPERFPKVECLIGDRDGGLGVLAGRRWDAVIDTSGYIPRLVRQSAMALEGAAAHYCFVSTISTYAKPERPGLDESAPIETIDDPLVETVTPETYGALKGGCETGVEAIFPGRSLVIRPGLIVGPHESSHHFTYWVDRLGRGGPMLAPGRAEAPTQLVDGRDLAAWMIRMAESGVTGTYNATGPAENLTLGALLEAGIAVLDSSAVPVWVDDDFLSQQADPVTLPFWNPAGGRRAGLHAVDCRRALAAGLKFRPLAESFQDSAAWLATRPSDHARKVWLTPAREAALLAAWRSEQPAAAPRSRGRAASPGGA